jgi:hypothetical protein
VSGLSAGDFHFYAVLVRDSTHNMALYTPNSRVAGPIFYTTSAAVSAAMGGISGADSSCASLRDPRAASDVTPKAVLATAMTRRACSTVLCTDATENVDWPVRANVTYYNIAGGVIGTTNSAGIFLFPLTNPLVPEGQASYSGLNRDWTSSGNDCAQYTNSNLAASVDTGGPSQKTESAISVEAIACSATTGMVPVRLLCVEP